MIKSANLNCFIFHNFMTILNVKYHLNIIFFDQITIEKDSIKTYHMDNSTTSIVYTSGRHDNAGIGRSTSEDIPGQISLPNGFITHIALGWKHGHAVINSQSFYSWGVGDSWRLATGKTDNLSTPTLVNTFPADFKFDMLVTGDKFGVALGINGLVYAWGSGYAHLPTIQNLKKKVLYIAASQKTFVAALENGSAVSVQRKLTPVYVTIPNEFISMVAASSDAFVCVCKSGNAFTWSFENQTPKLLKLSEFQATRCFAYQRNYFFVDSENQIFCYGGNEDGSLGLGITGHVDEPRKLDHKFESQVIQIAVGDDFSLVLTDDGKVYGTGNSENNRTLISIENRTSQNRFIECDFIKNKHATQIAAGCFTSAILINGALPPHLGKPYKTIEEFPTPEDVSSMIVGDVHSILVGPNPEVFQKIGLMQGDILRKGEERFKVLGISENKRVVVVNSNLKVVELHPEHNFVEDYILEFRNNANLESFKKSDGSVIVVDLDEAPLIKKGGLKINDKLENGCKIIGTRGDFIFALDPNGNLVYVDFNKDINKVYRDGKEYTMRRFLKNLSYIVETTSDSGEICCSNEYGAGEIVGKIGNQKCIRYASLYGLLKMCEEDTTICKKKDVIRDLYTESLTPYQVSIYEMAKDKSKPPSNDNVIYPLDFVSSPRGFGTVAGFSTSDDHVAVWLENNVSKFGLITLFNKNDINVIGRFFSPCIIESGIKASTDDLAEFHLLPGDEITGDITQNKRAMVRGVKDNSIVLKLLESNTDINVIFKTDEKIQIIKRHMMAACNDALEGSSLYRFQSKNQIEKI